MQVTTLVLTENQTITINEEDGVQSISVMADPTGGQFSILGNIPFKGIVPQQITLSDSTGVTLVANNPQNVVSGLTITWVSGIVQVVIGWN